MKALSLAGLFFCCVAWATSFYERPFEESVQDAPVIVRGRVGATSTDWGRGNDANKRIYTFWELQIDEVLKGDAGGQLLMMRELGGEKDGVGMQVSGAAHFERGEDVVVFLSERNTEGTYDLWGMMMAKYNVRKDAHGRETLEGPGIQRGGRADARKKPKWTLRSLRALIASQGGGPASQPTPGGDMPSVAPSSAPPPEAAPSPEPTASLAAPQLQSSPPEQAPFPGWLVLGALALGVGMVWVALKRR